MQGKRAVIIGGSVGGLFAANFLIKHGWTVDILEQAQQNLASRGTGIARHDELEEIFKALGISPDDTVGVDVNGRTAFDRTGAIISHFDLTQRLGAWNRVFQPLYDAFPTAHYHNGARMERLETSGDVTTVITSAGRRFEADVVIGADGFRSAVRKIVAPEIDPAYSGYVAWRGVSREASLSEAFRTNVFHHYAFLFMRSSLLIGYPMAGEDGSIEPGGRRYNYLWYYPAPGQELTDILTDADGKVHDYGIPPPLMRPGHVEAVKENARRDMPASFHDAINLAETTIVQPIYDVLSQRITFGKVALIGDAAFVARPHVGVGVLKAGQDAVSLATALAECETIPEAMARYEAERLRPGQRAVWHGRDLGSFIERGLDRPEDDPNYNLPPERAIRISGRPVEHIFEQGL
jgi:2-polyprenyl-6-methoxyphenol hydroxylase-like FAD-dependent oxidoreductase